MIEMVAIAVHQIAATLFELDTSVHKNDGITEWAPPKSDYRYWEWWHPDGPLPSLFHHDWYKDYDQYPRGVADMVGYWAEARILGGVVLFDRRNPGAEPTPDPDELDGFKAAPTVDPDAIYLHPDRYQVTYRICQLLPEQRQALLNFLLADELPSENPIPIVPNQDNRIRVDPEESIRDTGIYRDLWERKDIPRNHSDARLRDVISSLDYPSLEDHFASRHRAFDRKRRIGYE